MENYEIVKSDFNKIAELTELKWNHNNRYFKYLLKFVPDNVKTILEIGCGKGELAYLLSEKSRKVVGVDLEEKMIEKANEKYKSNENIEFINGNILDLKFDTNSLDIIITTSTAHHLPYEWLLKFAKDNLKVGGKLIILDLYKISAFSDHILSLSAVIPNVIMNLFYNHSLKNNGPHSQEIWAKHGEHDNYRSLKEIKNLTKKYLPNAKIKRKLFWRYVLIWKK